MVWCLQSAVRFLLSLLLGLGTAKSFNVNVIPFQTHSGRVSSEINKHKQIIRSQPLSIINMLEESSLDAQVKECIPIEDQVLDVAIRASKLAGEIIRAYSSGAEVKEQKSNSRDLLTKFDLMCEKVSFQAVT